MSPSVPATASIVSQVPGSVRVNPTADLGASPEPATGQKSLSVTQRPGLVPQSTLDRAGPGLGAEAYGRGPAERPLSQRPDDDSSPRGNA